MIRAFRADVDPAALGRTLTMLSDVRLREQVDRAAFERGLDTVAQVVSAMRLTGEYDYELRLACTDPAEFETVIDLLKRDHGVRELRSRMLLHEVALGSHRLLQGSSFRRTQPPQLQVVTASVKNRSSTTILTEAVRTRSSCAGPDRSGQEAEPTSDIDRSGQYP